MTNTFNTVQVSWFNIYQVGHTHTHTHTQTEFYVQHISLYIILLCDRVSHTPISVATLDRSLWHKCWGRRISYHNRDSAFSV